MPQLDPKTSIAVGLGLMGLVAYTYDQVLPEVADIRVANPGDSHIAAAEKTARWTAAGLVVLVSVIAADATVFIMGGTAVIALSWMHRHANFVHPTQGTVSLPSSRNTVHADDRVGAGTAL